MSISRLQASLAQATNEVTVAAANINFDFCLVKYEAPKEYHPIGELLSAKRKQDAEHGKCHVTARRLAALFDGICPDTPNLIKAYGKRVSEVSRKATDQESKEYTSSVFGSYAGVDATSIWAAATSSPSKLNGAIHVHLLACILALMFDAAEATAIWVELVEEQRKAITMSWERDESMPFSLAAAAAQQAITRGRLAEWDASARAWLQTADSIMESKQTQLRLILRNVSFSMGPKTSMYLSVIDTWKKTLGTMERLVSGVPQEVQDGSAIIGLASWHIYPDICVFGSRNVEVYMNDPLVAPGGILSLGCSPSATTPVNGVSWSLSLAQLKYYGQPVNRQGSFKPDPSRITFKELLLVTLGCILSRWNVSMCQTETSEAIKIISLLSKNTPQSIAQKTGNHVQFPRNLRQRVEGLRLLSRAAEEYFADKETSLRFINLGRNRSQFLPPRTHVGGSSQNSLRPFLGLDKIDALLQCFRDADGRVELLRRMATRSKGLEEYACIIQYTDEVHREENTVNYATVFPQRPEPARDIQQPAAKKGTTSHVRWVHPDLMDTKVAGENLYVNEGYSIYAPSTLPRITCTHKPRHCDRAILRFWYGDWDLAAIYVHSDLGIPLLSCPKITKQDLLWCLEHDLLSPESLLLQAHDSVMQTLECLAAANEDALRTIPGAVIQVQILSKPLIDADCMAELVDSRRPVGPRQPVSSSCRTISVLSYLAAGHDIQHSKIPSNIVGISIGNSIFVPERLLCDPMLVENGGSFSRILGNIGKPGFVMFFSVESPIVPPRDTTFWRAANPQKFDGVAADLFQNTSMHLSFTNWERPLEGYSSRSNQDIQLALMESVISIRERGRWIGDVDVIPALRSPTIYQLPAQEPCNHSKLEPINVQMTSIECWDELREFHAGNVVVRANGNWLARLATTSYLAQCAERGQYNIKRITLCPRSVCWKCLKDYIEQYPANVYIY